jgi:hypothetical protein
MMTNIDPVFLVLLLQTMLLLCLQTQLHHYKDHSDKTCLKIFKTTALLISKALVQHQGMLSQPLRPKQLRLLASQANLKRIYLLK